MNEKEFLGVSIRTWTYFLLYSVLGALVLFIGIPFLLAIFLPIINPEYTEKYNYLVDILDGVSIILGIIGTVASVFSIIMTLVDRKRFIQEKKQTDKLMKSVNMLHDELDTVHNFVKQTFEQNQRLALELYNNNIINTNPNVNIVVSTGETLPRTKNWENKEFAGEIVEDLTT